jgi:competence protein ComEC
MAAPELTNPESSLVWITRSGRRIFVAWFKPQLVIFVVLLLPLLSWGQTPSILSPLTNTLAIPAVGFVAVPLSLLLALLAVVGDEFAGFLLVLLDGVFAWLIGALQWLALLQTHWHGQPNSEVGQAALFAWGCAGLGVAMLLAPLKRQVKLLSLSLLLPLLWPAPVSKHFELAVHVLDVGQGLAVVVETAEHTLLYDTGFGIADGFSVGQTVVVPALRRLGVQRLDTIVISHGDNDHIGGLNAVLNAFPDSSLIANGAVVRQAFRPAQNCAATAPWQWGGVWFHFLQTEGLSLSDNNQSCVLKVSTADASVLLPGDIERSAELLLATDFAGSLASELLIAPHHGSKSSSSYPFLKKVQPQVIIVSAGYNNRFGHPSPEIVERYETLGIDYFVSHREGMLSVIYPPAGANQIAPLSYRKSMPRYWR